MSVAPSEALERSVLEGKDREQLLTIAAALGVKPGTRAKKADIIDKILEQVGVPTGAPSAAPAEAPARKAPTRTRAVRAGVAQQPALPALDEPAADDSAEPAATAETAPIEPASTDASAASAPAEERAAPARPAVVLGPDGEPLAEWELDLDDDEDGADDGAPAGGPQPNGQPGAAGDGPGEAREGRRRRRRRNRNRGAGEDGAVPPAPGAAPVVLPAVAVVERPERPEDARLDVEAVANEPVDVAGYVDLREEGFGFLRVHGFLPSKDDIYVSVKQVRQYGLRRGDHVAGTSRPAGRNEKNPALLSITAVNGGDPDAARARRRFDDLTPVPATVPLTLSSPEDPGDVVARAIDLVAPLGRGQRALVVAPPRSGRTTLVAAVAAAVARRHPDVHLLVVLLDERPEDVTEVRRATGVEVVASAFDGKPSEHTQVAEMAVERAKRLVEAGEDVVLVVDGLTRLARAYNLTVAGTGRTLVGGLDAAAIHPTKRFFGAGRALEEGGSLTVVATVASGTGSKVDEAILDELGDTAGSELRLDRGLAERQVFPAIDVAASGTRYEDRLVGAEELAARRALRSALAGASTSPIEALLARLAGAPTNDAVLAAAQKG